MSTAKVSREIAAPVDQVFAAFTDIERGSKNVSAIRGIEMLTVGSFRLGSRWRETREVLGRIDDAEMEVTSYEKDRHYTITHHKAGVRIDTTFSFQPTAAGTLVSLEFALNPQGLPPAALAPIEWAISGKVREALDQDLRELKASVERAARV